MHSILKYNGTGTTGPFVVNFTMGFLSKETVTAYLDDDPNVLLSFTWVNSGLITMTAPVPVGKKLVIRRTTSSSVPIHDYKDTAVLDEASLDETAAQALMLIQEMQDLSFPTFFDDAIELSRPKYGFSVPGRIRGTVINGQVTFSADFTVVSLGTGGYYTTFSDTTPLSFSILPYKVTGVGSVFAGVRLLPEGVLSNIAGWVLPESSGVQMSLRPTNINVGDRILLSGSYCAYKVEGAQQF